MLLKYDVFVLCVFDVMVVCVNWFGCVLVGLLCGVVYLLYIGCGGVFSMYVVVVVEVCVMCGSVRFEWIVCGIDCGCVINLLLICEMVEGGVGFVFINMFRSEIMFEYGVVV